MDTLDLSDFFKTKAESIDFSTRLAAISEKIYKTDFDLEKTLMEEFGLRKKDKFVTLLRNNKINIESQSALSDFFGKIVEKISTLSVLSITLAFEPTEKTLEVLSEWFLLNINKQFLFDFKVDFGLIAGAQILANGRHFDFSIRSKFDQALKDVLADNLKQDVVDKDNTDASHHEGHQSAEHIALGR